ncbi:MAG: 50S ribosomal protein L15 [Planctomycetes bacterium]|nr:50S ribosomal protein L15 [Planctomycetota bacterium]
MNLHELNDAVAGKPVRHRIGRGPGSGWGCTAGRGNNGARCRSGYKTKFYREGGQMPLVRRIAKRGFNNKNFGKVWAFVNLHDLNAFADGDVVTPEECLRRGLIPKVRSGLKVLGVGTLERKLTIKCHRVSETAKAAIDAKGGTIELIPVPGEDARKDWKAKRGKGKRSTRRNEAQARADAKKPKPAAKGKR